MAEHRKQQVSLRGASTKEITRDALLEKVSQERELRNYTRRAAAASLFIQRVWRRYSATKKVVLQVQEEWEAVVNHPNVLISAKWISSCLLRPFLFFITRSSIAQQKLQPANMKCMMTCFKILLQSINSTESQKNFCSLATGTLEERTTWIYQAKKLISVSSFVLAECDPTCPVGHDTSLLTSVAMRVVVALTDSKAWKSVSTENLGDADIAVKHLVKFIATGKSGVHRSIRRYLVKVGIDIVLQRNPVLQRDDHFLIIASAITMALRPFQAVKLVSDDSVHLDMQDAVEQYCVFLLTVPWLAQRLPTILVPALKHQSVLSPCLNTLLTSNEKIFMEISKLDNSEVPDSCLRLIPYVGWALANIINLATECQNDSLSPGKFAPGLDCTVYVHVVSILAEKLLAWLDNAGCSRKENHECLENFVASAEVIEPAISESQTTFGSLKLSHIDLFRPVHQQWHLMMLLAFIKKDALILETGTSPNQSLECLRKLELLDIAYFYSYMLRVFSSLNPAGGSLPILNLLSFTPGFLVYLWQALEGSIFLEKSHSVVGDKPCTSATEVNQNDENTGRKQRLTSKDAGNKWVTVLQKITGKSSRDVDDGNLINDPPSFSQVEGDLCDTWDVEPFKQGPQGLSKDMLCLLHLFSAVYSHLLLVLDDIEFYEKQVPFTLEQQRKIASVLNTLVYNGFSHSSLHDRPLMDAAVRCLHLLYERDCRHQYCPPSLWLSPAKIGRPPVAAAARAHEAVSANPRSGEAIPSPSMGSAITTTPHVFPFEERVQMFREFIKLDKVSRRMAGEVAGPGPGSIEIVVRRGHIVEDGFKQLNSLGSRLKSSIHVSFVSECGLPEAGLDYGGLSKEFLTDISKTAFDPDYGIFLQTLTSERHIIPNTSARLLDNGMQMIEFLGRVVGKALYEGILLDYSFSPVFVQKILGRYSFLDELSTLDSELYRNLMYVKHYDGDVKELSLDFTVTEEILGKHIVSELKPGGKDVAVTNENKLQYVHAIADFKLNRQILPLANTFYRGLTDLISPSWLSIFNASEFNQLLSGGSHDIDVDDLRDNTRYTGGYSEGSRTVKLFWEVIAGFEPKDRSMLLKFVTSCSRAPLLGFKHLQPAFTIHKVACDVPLWASIGGQDVDRLPSASTCYNTLKLPTYKRASTLRSKLLYAINSNAGFELS
ncbi:HECT [Macleaya cordata]|uniref:HECT-type E3 ubiquitin transferase n=1 Tax=Macleaya cordata TaxID=56857 RepID=A0A200R9S3_MACCD|nr:HECT [Macleaya cordata]